MNGETPPINLEERWRNAIFELPVYPETRKTVKLKLSIEKKNSTANFNDVRMLRISLIVVFY